MAIFIYGCLGALLPELYRTLQVRGKVMSGDLPGRTAIALSVMITLAWAIASGIFATALPGDVSGITAVYAGLSLPVTITKAASGAPISIDTISLDESPRLGHVFWRVFFGGYQ